MDYILVLAANYLIGSVPFAYIVGRLYRGIDIRKHGSGNVGATNAFRILGTWPGLLVFAADMGKGIAGVCLARGVGGSWFVVLAALVVMAGHNYSVFLGFKGGRGVATGAGIILSLTPVVILLAVGIFVIILITTRYVSLASIIAAGSVPVLMVFFNAPLPVNILGLTAAAFVIYRHRPNIRRLLDGTEPKVTDKAK